MIKPPAARADHHSGYALAMLSAIMLITSGLIVASILLNLALTSQLSFHSIGDLMTHSAAFPILVYLVWGLGVFGSAGSICAVAVYGFRERWFWRWLVVAAVLWLMAPPAHAAIGLISLIVLLRSRHSFPKHQGRNSPAS